jgi:hypothetical protein
VILWSAPLCTHNSARTDRECAHTNALLSLFAESEVSATDNSDGAQPTGSTTPSQATDQPGNDRCPVCLDLL